MSSITLRILTRDDAPLFREVWLRALHDHPTAFGSSDIEETLIPVTTLADRIANNPAFGAWDDARLVGITQLFYLPRMKTRHRAMVGAVYVDPAVRAQGIARRLVSAAIDHARTVPYLEELTLAVTVGNHTAMRVYQSLGFTFSYREPRYLKVAGEYHDLDWMVLRLVPPQ